VLSYLRPVRNGCNVFKKEDMSSLWQQQSNSSRRVENIASLNPSVEQCSFWLAVWCASVVRTSSEPLAGRHELPSKGPGEVLFLCRNEDCLTLMCLQNLAVPLIDSYVLSDSINHSPRSLLCLQTCINTVHKLSCTPWFCTQDSDIQRSSSDSIKGMRASRPHEMDSMYVSI
jgi:hypothetical protein